MAITFNAVCKHGTREYAPIVKYGFEGDNDKVQEIEDYFVHAGFATKVEGEPDVMVHADEVEIDPETIHNDSRLKVSDLIAAASSTEA